MRIWSRIAGRYSSGCARPSSTASSMACTDASGARRSWLAQATSCRRASKRRSIDSAMPLNARPSSDSSRGPCSVARAPRSPAASSLEALRSRSIGLITHRPKSSAPTTADNAAADETARIFASSCMWNITHPDASTAASGSTTAKSASAASCSRTVGSSRSPYAASSPAIERRGREDERDLGHGVNR